MTGSRIGASALAVLLGFALTSSCSSQPGGVAGGLHFDASSTPDAQPDSAEADAPVEAPPPPCDPAAPPGDGVFVSPTGSDDAQGTELAPLKTVAAGLVAMHQSSKSTLYLEEGTYDEELTLSVANSGIIIEGGWTRLGGAWRRDCSADAADKTLIASPSNVGASLNPRVIATLRHLAITTETRGASEPGQPGESCYGILAQGGATLFLTDVNVTAGDGGPGGAAMPGLQPGTPTCNGETDCSDGAAGNAGQPGSAASASGSFDTTGYLPESGTDGAAGEPGHNGTAGQPGGTGSCSTSCGPPQPCDPGTPMTGTPGTCGCGGGGGAPGGRGQGGGASVGVLAIGATTTVSVTASDITAQDGGNGSPGGTGGGGQAGTSGAAGPSTPCIRCVPILTTCLPESITLAGGAAGGDGGPGGPGGRGGDAAGGPSYAIVTVGGAAVNADAASALAFGNGGQGAGQAASGAAGKRLNVP